MRSSGSGFADQEHRHVRAVELSFKGLTYRNPNGNWPVSIAIAFTCPTPFAGEGVPGTLSSWNPFLALSYTLLSLPFDRHLQAVLVEATRWMGTGLDGRAHASGPAR